MVPRPSALIGALSVALAVALGACTGAPSENPSATNDSAPPSDSASPSESAPPADSVYVSLGDSYATGYRPPAAGTSTGADGFAYLVAEQSDLRLINVACSGATSAQLLGGPACAPGNVAPGAPDPAGRTQLDAAVQALREHQGRVGLVTVVIGGNDLAPCARAADALGCASRAVANVRAGLAATLPALREAAGDAPIVGLTYPDVFLGAWVSPAFPNGQDLARLSVPLFRDFFNAALKTEYEKVGATFVDVTASTGGYGPFTEITQDPTYGSIPTSVAKVCALTYFCGHTDVHPTPDGHKAIASAVLTATGR
ncbi:lysophospholipase L1-like esterase [Saccharothrix ecbatanensis]|uniref:Lysophospholipase L1-like esterase n=1 Tax=Saccharothrix ecbatanensis TaxID=1105145 RepID=A0A7W9LZV5_9PSEU|nr:GDSL-type esterase/lipase family protein [Saccharothrix ecbatanensis]MBB5802123.1 lysophospholipase L1-like esterase [Saccharothrix ecbatanensis]